MCLSIPARILSIEGEQAKVTVRGAEYSAGLHMLDNPQVGDYVLLHAGFAIQKISEKEAKETLELLNEMDNL